jgi:hypothetical protein
MNFGKWKIATYELKLNQKHVDLWAYQTHFRKTRPTDLFSTADPGKMQAPHLDCIKGRQPAL